MSRHHIGNTADTDVLGYLQDVEQQAREFHDEYDRRACSGCGYDEFAADIVRNAKYLLNSIEDARERQAELDRRVRAA